MECSTVQHQHHARSLPSTVTHAQPALAIRIRSVALEAERLAVSEARGRSFDIHWRPARSSRPHHSRNLLATGADRCAVCSGEPCARRPAARVGCACMHTASDKLSRGIHRSAVAKSPGHRNMRLVTVPALTAACALSLSACATAQSPPPPGGGCNATTMNRTNVVGADDIVHFPSSSALDCAAACCTLQRQRCLSCVDPAPHHAPTITIQPCTVHTLAFTATAVTVASLTADENCKSGSMTQHVRVA